MTLIMNTIEYVLIEVNESPETDWLSIICLNISKKPLNWIVPDKVNKDEN